MGAALAPEKPHRANCRSRGTTRSSAAKIVSTSPADEFLPKLNRTAARASSHDNPIAVSTCDGSSEPTAQADPLDTATPSKSKPSNNPLVSQPTKLKFTVLPTRNLA